MGIDWGLKSFGKEPAIGNLQPICKYTELVPETGLSSIAAVQWSYIEFVSSLLFSHLWWDPLLFFPQDEGRPFAGDACFPGFDAVSPVDGFFSDSGEAPGERGT